MRTLEYCLFHAMKISTKIRLVHELVNTLDCLMYTKSLENKVFSCIFLLFAFSILSVSSVTDYVLLFAIKSLAYRSKVAKFVFFLQALVDIAAFVHSSH